MRYTSIIEDSSIITASASRVLFSSLRNFAPPSMSEEAASISRSATSKSSEEKIEISPFIMVVFPVPGPPVSTITPSDIAVNNACL